MTKTIQSARQYAAQINYELSASAFDDDFGFADHVTNEQKAKYAEDQLIYANEIEQGLHDGNFTIWQRMNYYLTGECVPLLK